MSLLIPNEHVDAPHALFILDQTGHTTLTWDAVDEANEIVREASVKFREHLRHGGLAYTTDKDGGNATAVKEFDPAAERIVLAPGMAGG